MVDIDDMDGGVQRDLRLMAREVSPASSDEGATMTAPALAANRHIAPNLAKNGPSSSNAAGPSNASSAIQSRPIEDSEVEGYREQDRLLPIANVARIMRASLPPDAKISKEAKECVQDCVSEFISFVTSEGSDRCLAEKRKTINGEDVLWATQVLGFDNYYDALKIYLAKYRTVANEAGRRRGRARDDAGEGERSPRKRPRTSGGAHDDADEEEDDDDGER